VTSAEQLQNLLAKSGRRVAVLVQRDDMKTFVPIELG
jgi:serine protease Do